jgi:hypothetical protein
MFHVSTLLQYYPSDAQQVRPNIICTFVRLCVRVRVRCVHVCVCAVVCALTHFSFRKKVERKRHLGNDVVMIIFREGENEPFSPKWVRSQFNHVFIVVTPVAHPKGKPGTWYKLAISCKEGVVPFQPRLPFPPYLRKGKKAREWFLSKRTLRHPPFFFLSPA